MWHDRERLSVISRYLLLWFYILVLYSIFKHDLEGPHCIVAVEAQQPSLVDN